VVKLSRSRWVATFLWKVVSWAVCTAMDNRQQPVSVCMCVCACVDACVCACVCGTGVHRGPGGTPCTIKAWLQVRSNALARVDASGADVLVTPFQDVTRLLVLNREVGCHDGMLHASAVC
jgi:hypothetical protein